MKKFFSILALLALLFSQNAQADDGCTGTTTQACLSLLYASTADGNKTAFSFLYPTGLGEFHAHGTWNGATLKLQGLSTDGTTWVDFNPPVSCTANCAVQFRETVKTSIRVVQSGSGGSTTVSASVTPLNN